jgi:glycosyltransferase involved in cell wall biosynthesis
MTLVSAIIPTIRRPLLLRRALASIFAQTHRDLEAIVVIDGPDPETAAMLRQIDDPRLRVLQNQHSLGPGGARNAGAVLAKGEWLAFLDDDDEWLPEKLARQLAAASAEQDVLICCRSRVITPHATYEWPRRLYDGVTPVDEYLWRRRSLFQGEAYIATGSFVVPRRLFLRTQFGSTPQNEDSTLLLRVTKQAGGRIVMVPDVLVVIHADDPKNSVGRNFIWRDCLAWLDSMGDLVTRQAYSGFCLVILASQARRRGDYAGLGVLLRRAFARGEPTPVQLALFAAFFLIPMNLRQRFGAWVQSLSGGSRGTFTAKRHADSK